MCYSFSRVRLFGPMDCSLPGSSIHGILQARILEWVVMLFSRGIFLTQESNPGLLPWFGFFSIRTTRGAPNCQTIYYKLSFCQWSSQLVLSKFFIFLLSPIYVLSYFICHSIPVLILFIFNYDTLIIFQDLCQDRSPMLLMIFRNGWTVFGS